MYDFDAPCTRRGTVQGKWNAFGMFPGADPDRALPMWIADSDYPTAPCVLAAARAAADHGVFGYAAPDPGYFDAITWWMKTRHDWDVDPDWIRTTQGLGHGIALAITAVSEPGDGVAFFTPVYHEFRAKTEKTGRRVTELPLALAEGRFELDLEDAQTRLTGRERVLILSSPHNPGGRLWAPDELRALADFARRNGMTIICDEIHHDIVFDGARFAPMHVHVPEAEDICIFATAPSKTFNIAGMRTGNLIIPNTTLRGKVAALLRACDYSPSTLGMAMLAAAYSPEGAHWADAQIAHLDKNRRTFEAGIAGIAGLSAMPLLSTFLSWVDFRGTGLSPDDIADTLYRRAQILPSPGPAFGTGGAGWMRFNLATQHSNVGLAVDRLTETFGAA